MTQISIEQQDAVLIASISNPPDGFMDGETEVELAALLDRVESDAGVRAVVLTGGLDGVFVRHYSKVPVPETPRAP